MSVMELERPAEADEGMMPLCPTDYAIDARSSGDDYDPDADTRELDSDPDETYETYPPDGPDDPR